MLSRPPWLQEPLWPHRFVNASQSSAGPSPVWWSQFLTLLENHKYAFRDHVHEIAIRDPG